MSNSVRGLSENQENPNQDIQIEYKFKIQYFK